MHVHMAVRLKPEITQTEKNKTWYHTTSLQLNSIFEHRLVSKHLLQSVVHELREGTRPEGARAALTCPSQVTLDNVEPFLQPPLHVVHVVQHEPQRAVHARQLVHQVAVVF